MARPTRPWFRFYVEAFGDRKIRRLTPTQRWVWVCVLGAARESPESGALFIATSVPMSRRELADYAGVSLREIDPALAAMKSLSMVDIAEDGLVRVCNWHSRQFESDDVTKRTREHRERSEEQVRNVPENEPETETETETEETPTSAPADGDFDRFWGAYPRRVAKGAARRAWKTALKKTDVDTLLAAVGSYARANERTEARFIQHPASWLNAERWADETNVRQLPGTDAQGRAYLGPLPPSSPFGPA